MKNITSILFNTMIGVLFASFLNVDVAASVLISNTLGLVPRPSNVFMAGLNKEIWIDEVLENFYPDWSFLKEARDMSTFVEYNTINLAEAGVDPTVLVNNTTYPIPFAQRTDVPIALPLDTYDTENTIVRNIEEMETAYEKMSSVTKGHKNALLNFMSKKAAWSYTPSSNAAFTPVIGTSGTGNGGFKNITLDDVSMLAEKFDDLDAPEGDRVLVLNPRHFRALGREDKNLYKAFVGNTQGFELFGFKVYKYSKTPIFNKSTGVKAAFGAAAAPSTDTISSFAFVGSEVMKAQGTIDLFDKLKDPEQRGDVLGFQMRALALPIRNKYIGAIYSAAV